MKGLTGTVSVTAENRGGAMKINPNHGSNGSNRKEKKMNAIIKTVLAAMLVALGPWVSALEY
jgi:hypothetical protein